MHESRLHLRRSGTSLRVWKAARSTAACYFMFAGIDDPPIATAVLPCDATCFRSSLNLS